MHLRNILRNILITATAFSALLIVGQTAAHGQSDYRQWESDQRSRRQQVDSDRRSRRQQDWSDRNSRRQQYDSDRNSRRQQYWATADPAAREPGAIAIIGGIGKEEPARVTKNQVTVNLPWPFLFSVSSVNSVVVL